MSEKCQQQKCRSVCWQPVSSRQARNFEFELVLSAFAATPCNATSSVSRRDDFARLPLVAHQPIDGAQREDGCGERQQMEGIRARQIENDQFADRKSTRLNSSH